MTRAILVTGLSLLVASCTMTDYVGDTYPATTHVDVFFDMDDIHRAHRVMGELRGEATEYLTFEKIEQDMVQKAMAQGADGIVFGEMETVVVGSTTSTTGSSDPGWYVTKDGKVKRKHDAHQYSTSTVTKDKVIQSKLIKYTD